VEGRSVGDSEGRKGAEEVAGHDWESFEVVALLRI
jgi:hypothetical protein